MARPPKKHYPSLIDPADISTLLRVLTTHRGTFPVRCALQLAPLLFVRPGNLRSAEWSEINVAAARWDIGGGKMKGDLPFIVPLPRQALAILAELRPLTGHSPYVFPGARSRDKCMSEAAVNMAIRRLGYKSDEFTGHGFRAMFRTVADEVLEAPPELIEQQLAHTVKDPLGRAYNRTKHLPQRVVLMQLWADYLDALRMGTKFRTRWRDVWSVVVGDD